MSDLLDDHQRGLLRALLYPILFEPYPTDGVERVLRQVVYAKAMNAQPGEYLAAVQAALQSGECLSKLLPQDHAEPALRAFLAELQKRLETPA
jgi:hypothetical protein